MRSRLRTLQHAWPSLPSLVAATRPFFRPAARPAAQPSNPLIHRFGMALTVRVASSPNGNVAAGHADTRREDITRAAGILCRGEAGRVRRSESNPSTVPFPGLYTKLAVDVRQRVDIVVSGYATNMWPGDARS